MSNDDLYVSASSIFEQTDSTQKNGVTEEKVNEDKNPSLQTEKNHDCKKKKEVGRTNRKDATVRPFAEAYHETYY